MTTVQSVRRYPVESALGVAVDAASVGPGGLAGDRHWAIIDVETGRVASATRPRLWRRLLEVRVEQPDEAGPAVVVLPDGTRVDVRDADEVLSRFLGRLVVLRSSRHAGASTDRTVPDEVLERCRDADVSATLLELSAQAPGEGFVDYAPVHRVTTATLSAVAALAGRPVDPEVLRPNLVLSVPAEAGFVEDGWVGRDVAVRQQVRLRVVLPTPRCAAPTLAHGSQAADPDVLRAQVRAHRVPVGGFDVLPAAGV